MSTRARLRPLPLAAILSCTATPAIRAPTAQPDPSQRVVRSHHQDLGGVHAGKDVTVSVVEDPDSKKEHVLAIAYSAAQGPADRDTWCDTEVRDWSGAHTLHFRVRSEQPLHISVSFFDANHVGYTAWADVSAGRWEPVDISLDTIRPNPYFQPSEAKLGSPIDLHDVAGIGFAPQVRGAGKFLVGSFAISR
jgi:hypothetical protein